MPDALFLYDFNSPYAYLAASRVDSVLPQRPRWQPVAFAFILRARQRLPWSMQRDLREAGMQECERRAEAYGLPPLRWPPDWPVGSYSLAPLRIALLAERAGRQREFAAAAFARNFVTGEGLQTEADVLAAARRAGLAEDDVIGGLGAPDLKAELKELTDRAVADGVHGVPTVSVGGSMFWGDDQLTSAAAAMAG